MKFENIDEWLYFLEESQLEKQNINEVIIPVEYVLLLILADSIYTQFTSEKIRACDKLNNIDKIKCSILVQVKGKEKQIDYLKNTINKCDKAKNPESCKRRIKERITDLEEKIKEKKKVVKHLKK